MSPTSVTAAAAAAVKPPANTESRLNSLALLVGEQLVRPAQRLLEAAVTTGAVAHRTPQEPQPLVEVTHDLGRRD